MVKLFLVKRLVSTPSIGYLSQSGHTYILDDSGNWCVTEDTDTAEVNLFAIFVRVADDSVLTDAKLSAAGFVTTTIIDSLGRQFYVVSTPDTSVAFAHLDSLESWSMVDWATFDVKMEYYATTNDPLLVDQWYLEEDATRVFSAWDFNFNLNQVEIITIDSGIDTNHEDIPSVAGEAVFTDQGWSDDVSGHGTATTGVMVAIRNNSTGLAGIVAKPGAAHVYIYALGINPTLCGMLQSFSRLRERIAGDPTPKRVVNMSLGVQLSTNINDQLDVFLNDMIDSDDVVVIAATGNGISQDHLPWPARNSKTIAVAGYSQNGLVLGQHSLETGAVDVDLIAPAEEIWTVNANVPTVKYRYQSGTSVAAPIVTAIAALVREGDLDLTWSEVRDILRHSAKKIPAMGGEYFTRNAGYGLVSALGSLVGTQLNAQLVSSMLDTSAALPDSRKPFTNLYCPEDITIDDGASIEITSGTTVYAATQDSLHAGNDPQKVEISLDDGSLIVSGGSSSIVSFRTAATGASENQWFGINVKTGTTFDAEYALVKNAVYGVVISAPDTASIQNCSFEYNGNCDIKAGGAGVHLPILIKDNAITVGGGTGIEVLDAPTGGLIDGNVITGNSSSSNGIYLGSFNSVSPTLTDNSVSGLTTGNAIYIQGSGSAPILTGNTFENSKYGVYIVGCAPTIGTSSSSSDNFINGNSTTGLYVEGSGGTPVVRNNQIDSNYHGVVGKTSGNPDLGLSSDNGNNSITNNSGYCLWNRTTGGGAPTIQAYGNWWGSNNAPTCYSGSVNVGGWLVTAPAGFAVEVEAAPGLDQFRLVRVGPNPLRGDLVIEFAISGDLSLVGFGIFDVTGRLVRDLGSSLYDSGNHSVSWDGRTNAGSQVVQGLYFVRAQKGSAFSTTAKFVVIR